MLTMLPPSRADGRSGSRAANTGAEPTARLPDRPFARLPGHRPVLQLVEDAAGVGAVDVAGELLLDDVQEGAVPGPEARQVVHQDRLDLLVERLLLLDVELPPGLGEEVVQLRVAVVLVVGRSAGRELVGQVERG